jgi:DNA-binding PadR family transcriptional regulator
MRQKLRILILRNLSERPRAGYGLIKSIEEQTGWKPSYGSIYPALDHLKEEGLVSCKEEGRKKRYSLTKAGKEELKTLKLDDKEAVATIDKLHRLALSVCGIKGEPLPVSDMMKSLVKPDAEMKLIMKKSYDMKLEFARLMKNKGYKKNAKRICEMMDAMTKELKSMK